MSHIHELRESLLCELRDIKTKIAQQNLRSENLACVADASNAAVDLDAEFIEVEPFACAGDAEPGEPAAAVEADEPQVPADEGGLF